eukprot:CAMPEP_0196152218 /NCGR_PEP_ID=MMETSP0910-20130528/35122_1 /TAXON_ID=49265 /ORGANISM="Thalassiosira rotula, Strain GSO102" /LENGTH=105 /DNA_ID=CAMNT_0041415763 /DNA_START=154 /DNA_END=471 /DNA_ORIENTATION=-
MRNFMMVGFMRRMQFWGRCCWVVAMATRTGDVRVDDDALPLFVCGLCGVVELGGVSLCVDSEGVSCGRCADDTALLPEEDGVPRIGGVCGVRRTDDEEYLRLSGE